MMKVLSLFMVFSCVLSWGVLCAVTENNQNHGRLGGEDISIKGADKSFLVDYEKQDPSTTDNESPPSQYETPSPPSPPSKPKKPSVLEERMSNGRGFASGVFEKAVKMVEEASSILPKGSSYYNPKELICYAYGKCKAKFGQAIEKTKEGFYRVKEGGRIGAQKEKESGDLVVDKAEHAIGKVEDREKISNMEDRFTLVGKAKEAWANTKEELREVGDILVKKIPRGEKTIETLKKIGLGIQKAHNTLWDDRSAKTKITGLFNELSTNITYLSKIGGQFVYETANHAATEKVMEPTMGVFQLLALSTAYGIHLWVCFVSRNVLARTLPRHQYVAVQSKICPIYSRALVASIGCALLAHCLRSLHFGLHSVQAYFMLGSLCLILFNSFYTKPRVTMIWFDKINLEKGKEKKLRKVDHHVVDSTADPQPSTSTSTDDEVTLKLQDLERPLKFMKALSVIVDVVTLVTLTAEVAYVGKSLSMI